MSKEKIGSKEIKHNNRQRIYHFIRQEKSVSKQDIVIKLQLSLPTVTKNLAYLRNKKLIDASGKIQYTGGRDATAFTYVEQAKMAIGIYISENHMDAVVVDLSGTLVEHVRERIKFNLGDDRYLKRLGDIVEAVKNKAQLLDENLLGVCIAVPSLVSEDGEEIRYGLTFDFKCKTRKEIAKYIKYKTRLIHDSKAAGTAEAWIDKRIKNAFYISLGNTVGGAVIFDNMVYQGDTQKGGEIGHMAIRFDGGERCYCGAYGCFETVCRAGVLDQYTEGDLEDFFELLKNGDATAASLWDKYLSNLAMGIHTIRMLFDNTVIIGGYIGAYIAPYMDILFERVNQRNPFGDKAEDFLIQCQYKVEATAAGAAIFYINKFLERI